MSVTMPILDILNKYNLTFEEQKDGQVRIPCPSKFTEEMTCVVNLEKNVYYCNCEDCKSGGGIKKLERLLSGKPSAITNGKKPYGAAALSREQLAKIGWEKLKNSGVDFFKANRRKVMSDWENYRNERLTKMYALFLVMFSLKDKVIGAKIYNYLIDMFEHDCIPDIDMHFLANTFLDYENIPKVKKPLWVRKGEEIVRNTINECRLMGDSKFVSAAMLIIFDNFNSGVPMSVIAERELHFYSTKKFEYTPSKEIFDWYKCSYNTMVYAFALFLLMVEEKDDVKQITLLKRIHHISLYSMIKFDTALLIEQYVEEDIYRTDWAREGTRLARLAWRNAGEYNKADYLNALFCYFKYVQPISKKLKYEGEKAI